MSNKKWIKIFIAVFILSSLPIGVINVIIDPLWLYSHNHRYNNIQNGFNERQQKTNFIYFNGLDDYDGILFGSSRTSFVNQNDFHNMRIYNYALDSMHAFEYEAYFNFAKKVKGEDFKYLIIGADFYNTMLPKDVSFENPDHYIDKTTSPFYKYRMLFSIDTYKRARTNIKESMRHKTSSTATYYTRNNVKHRPKVTEQDRSIHYKAGLKRHTEKFIGTNYEKNLNYINILRKIKRDNPNTKIIIYTSPVTADLLTSIIVNANKMNEYELWLNDLIDTFGEVHHFMDINSITTNLQNYPDDDHYYPHIAKLVANKISKKENKNTPEDFGLILNRENIDNYLLHLKQQIKDYPIKSI